MISKEERKLLRDLAQQVADAAALPVMAERRELWKRHNSLRPARPMILVFAEGAWRELLPDVSLKCTGKAARAIEWNLRHRLYTHEHLLDDTVVEKDWVVQKVVKSSGWGLEPKWRAAPSATGAGAFEPVLHAPADLKKLRFPEISVDDKATAADMAGAQDLFGYNLDVKLKGVAHVSFHLMSQYTHWRGLNETMMDMYDNPSMLHDAMAFLEEATAASPASTRS